MKTLIIIWLLIGLITAWRSYHGTLKLWYTSFNHSYWKEATYIEYLFMTAYLLTITLGGILSFLFFLRESERENMCWWFNTPKEI